MIQLNVCDSSLARELIRAALDDSDNNETAPMPRIGAVLGRVYTDHGQPPDAISRLIVAVAIEAARCASVAASAAEVDGLGPSEILDLIAGVDRDGVGIVPPRDH